MYSHEVINDINWRLKRSGNIMDDDVYLANMKILKGALRDSHKFHLGNMEGYNEMIDNMVKNDDTMFMGDNGDYVKMPYKNLWIDYCFTANDDDIIDGAPSESLSTRRGIYACEIFPDVILCQTVNYVDIDKKWIPSISMHVFIINDTFENRPDALQFLNNKFSGTAKDGILETIRDMNYCFIPVSTLLTQMHDSGEKGRETVWGALDEDRAELMILNMALKLLCCKNIVEESVEPTKRIKRKKKMVKVRDKRKWVFHILKLKLPKTRKSSDGSSNNGGGTMKVHFRRGHFKIYTEDAPLFGRHVGRYWWQPSVRGNKENGLVLKTYDVEPDETANLEMV